ncbi:AraC family transcriptional regulator [Pseudomonas putida]
MARIRPRSQSVSALDDSKFQPSAEEPLRCTVRFHPADTEIQAHSHSWIQIVFSTRGIIRVSMQQSVYTVQPWRAIWIPAGVEHVVTVLADSELHSLHLLVSRFSSEVDLDLLAALEGKEGRVMEVGVLLRGLVRALADEEALDRSQARYRALCTLTLLEVLRAPSVQLGIVLPSERRLRAFCESFLACPRQDRSMHDLANKSGASVSTITRLFHTEMGSTFQEWRQKVLLAHALTLAAKGMPIAQIAFELGYSNPSAFSFMVTRLVGMPPNQFLRRE